MKEIFYHYGRAETENLSNFLNDLGWSPWEKFSATTRKLLGLDFPTEAFYRVSNKRSNLYAVAIVVDEKQYLLAKLKYGI